MVVCPHSSHSFSPPEPLAAALEHARNRFERAVQTGAYQEARRSLDEYTRAVNAAHDAAAVSSALDLLRWAGRAVRADRAHAASKLGRLTATRPYRPPRRPPAGSIQLEG